MSENACNKEVKQVLADNPNIPHKLVETIYLNSGSSLMGSMLGVVILTVIFIEHVSLNALTAWGVYMLVVTLGRYSLLYNYKSSTSVVESSKPWDVYFYTGTVLNGLGWGTAAWVLFTPEALLQAIVYITLAGIMAAGVVALAARHVAVICFLAPITIIGLSRLVTANDKTHFALAAMLSLFSAFLYRFAKTSEHTLIESLRLRYENKSLLEYLELSNKELTETSKNYIELNNELTKMRDEALRLVRAKSEFLATMSHEIRTPMNGVLGMIELLLGSKLSDQQQRFAETVRRSGETLLSIINDILDFSKIEAGKLTLENTNFNLRNLVEDLGETFSISAHSKGLELACMVPADIPETVTGDPVRLRQIMTNLIGNAIKFTESGEVLINVQLREETDTEARVRIEIKDTGIGLQPGEIDRIFESFSQADGSTTRKYGGTGLGLAISRQLVEIMGGKLTVDSVHGLGSSFWFELNLKKQQLGHDTGTGTGVPVIDFGDLHVLVVDDNFTNREILDHHLEAWNISHACCEGGAQALELLHAAVTDGNPFNMIILDYHMPEMDGLELARTVNTDNRLSGTRMVMFSSVDDIDIQEARCDFGIDYSITKPVRQSELYNCLINKNVPEYRGTVHDENEALPAAGPRYASQKILVVEDNEVNQAVAIGMLKQLGCRGIDTAINGREAVEKVERGHYDLVLMDMQMPVMDGYEATGILREREQALAAEMDRALMPHMPIVALTANAMEGDRERCLDAGADDYLSKPFTPLAMRKVLDQWLPETGHRDDTADRQEDASAPETAAQVNTEPENSIGIQMETSASPIDQSVLDVIRDMEDEDDPDMLSEIIGLYLNRSDELLQELEVAIAGNDAEAMRVAAHTLKSSSANVGARALSEYCRELEEMGRNGSLENAATRLAQLVTEYREVRAALAVELKGNAA